VRYRTYCGNVTKGRSILAASTRRYVPRSFAYPMIPIRISNWISLHQVSRLALSNLIYTMPRSRDRSTSCQFEDLRWRDVQACGTRCA
jgi:hypothetical protein